MAKLRVVGARGTRTGLALPSILTSGRRPANLKKLRVADRDRQEARMRKFASELELQHSDIEGKYKSR